MATIASGRCSPFYWDWEYLFWRVQKVTENQFLAWLAVNWRAFTPCQYQISMKKPLRTLSLIALLSNSLSLSQSRRDTSLGVARGTVACVYRMGYYYHLSKLSIWTQITNFCFTKKKSNPSLKVLDHPLLTVALNQNLQKGFYLFVSH